MNAPTLSSLNHKLKPYQMSEDIELIEGEPSIADDHIFSEQINLLLNMMDMDFTALYDEWQEDKVKVVTTAMKIINTRQKNILKELK